MSFTGTSSDDFLSGLNPEQRAAAEHGGQGVPGPLLVIAGAGSGKTTTLAHRVAHLLRQGADPQRVLLLTFSRRAAHQMNQRVGAVLQRWLGASGAQAPELPWAGTFHSVGARLLRRYAERIGLSEAFSVHDRGDAEDLMGMVRQQLGLAASTERFPLKSTCLSIYSRVVNGQDELAAILQGAYPWCSAWEAELRRLFAAYVAAKQEQQVLDYDDLLLYWAAMLDEPGIAAELGAAFDHVLVDEYQDTNRLQARILRGLKPDGRGVTVVGDDAQSIYGFRAATVRNILDFPDQFDPPARVVTLDRNYRSTQPILAASNAVIAQAAERYAKALWTDRVSSQKPELVAVSDESGQARWVADQVLAQREAGVRLISQAVLFRSASHSAQLELELVRRNIPFVKFGGLKFLEASHIKDVLSLLRWAENPGNRLAGFRAAQLVAGIGPTRSARLLDAVQAVAVPAEAIGAFDPGSGARDEWAAFAALMRGLMAQVAWPGDLEQAVNWYDAQLERLHDDAAVRRKDLEQLVRVAASYGTRERFLTELALDPPDATSAEAGPPLLDEDYLILSTIHSAKGQEWHSVYLLSAVDGCLPSDMATGTAEEIEEERRLLYVAMTRAKTRLQLVVPQRFYVRQQGAGGDRHVYGARTRFIEDAMLPLFERLPKAPPLPPLPEPRLGAKQPAVDLAARIRATWM
ncbi:ATP-dependent helicase [Verticiella sediminum]|uniref:DNA 3'-5' helicase n=1 Tax=Verticiella sediminum TaxID=1247510 RepID=A0A556A7N5_9BURK|nr:ATP-dependent helicase [Verticiella sediminum]TSH88888.1 ATP-dependent helicase [Verticiella sediminum]